MAPRKFYDFFCHKEWLVLKYKANHTLGDEISHLELAENQECCQLPNYASVPHLVDTVLLLYSFITFKSKDYNITSNIY